MRRISRMELIRQMGKKRFLTIAVIAFLLLTLPATVYLALTKQLIFKRAAFGEVTVNLVPTEVTKSVGEPFTVELYLNSGDLPVSAVTFWPSFQTDKGGLGFQTYNIQPEVGEGKPFTDYLPSETAGQPLTLLSKKATEQLPKGNIKVATLTFIGYGPAGSGVISSDLSKTQIIGANEQNEDVSLTVKEGTKVAYTITGELCPTASCPTNITLKEEARDDGRFNIRVSWNYPPTAPPTSPTFKIFRNIGAPVPADHPQTFYIGTTSVTSFLDTNNNQGFEGKAEVHYDIDAYQACLAESVLGELTTPTPRPTEPEITPREHKFFCDLRWGCVPSDSRECNQPGRICYDSIDACLEQCPFPTPTPRPTQPAPTPTLTPVLPTSTPFPTPTAPKEPGTGKKEIEGGKITLLVGQSTTIRLTAQGSSLPPELRQKEIALVMDRSKSMSWRWDGENDKDPSHPVKMDKAKEALNKFVDLSNSQSEKLSLVSYAAGNPQSTNPSNHAKLEVGLTNDYSQIKSGINRLNPEGATSIGSGLKLALDELLKQETKTSQYVVLATDGQQNIDPSIYSDYPGGGSILQKAAGTNIVVYTVGIGKDVEGNADYCCQPAHCASDYRNLPHDSKCPTEINTGEKYLQDIAQKTGGKYFFAETPEALLQVYEAIRGEIGKLEVAVSDHLTPPYFSSLSISKVTDAEEKEVAHQLVASDFAVKGSLGLLGENEQRNIYLQAKIAAGQGGGPWQTTVDNEAEPNKIIYKNPADKSVVYEKDFENKTVTISSGVCQQDAVITLPAQAATLKFKIKFQGVDWANLREEDKVQKVKLTVIKQVYQQVGTPSANLQNQEPVTIMSKEFPDVGVRPEKVGTDPIAIWSGQVSLTGVPVGDGYSVLIKGPKHLQRKFCQDKPTERAEEGYPYQCKGPGKIALKGRENLLDFSGVLLQGGDLPGPKGQDGVVNAHDVSLIISILKTGQSRKEEDLKRADIDLNGMVNFKDRSYLIETLEEKYGDEE